MTKARNNADNVSGDISEVTAGTGISVSNGTGPAPAVALTTPVASTNGGTGLSSFTTGDIIYSSSGNTLAKLGIGTTSQVLTVAGGLPSWAAASSGGMTLINTGGTTLSGSSTTISSIPATYTNLYVVIILSDPQDDGGGLLMRFNGDDTANRHARVTGGFSGGNVTFNQTSGQLTYSQDNGTPNGIVIVEIPFYANTSIWKYFRSSGVVNSYLDQAKAEFTTTACAYNQTGAVTSLEFFFNGGVIASGGTIYVYGVK